MISASTVVAGLVNFGNTCYANALLQVENVRAFLRRGVSGTGELRELL